jgi:RimJ/RimL family protein N-acetyltransferase
MTYLMERYPAELIDVMHLAGGARVTIRPVLPQDEELLAAFFRDLSDDSRRNRFFRSLRDLPAGQAHSFTSIDYHAHFALIATILGDAGELIVAEARYVIVEAGEAEFAVTVADAWQGHGIGRLLLARLSCRATSEGLDRLFGDVLLTNKPMQRLARAAGMQLALSGDGLGLMRAEKHLERLQRVTPCVGRRVGRAGDRGLIETILEGAKL